MSQDQQQNISLCTFGENQQLVKGVTMTKSVSCNGFNLQFFQPQSSQQSIINQNTSKRQKENIIFQKLLLDSSESQKQVQIQQQKFSYQLSHGSSFQKQFNSPKNQNISKSTFNDKPKKSRPSYIESTFVTKNNKQKQYSPPNVSNKYIRSTKGAYQELNSSLSRKGALYNSNKREKVFQQQTKKKNQKQWENLSTFNQTLLKSYSLQTLDRCNEASQKIKKIIALQQYCKIKHSISNVSNTMDEILMIVDDAQKQRVFFQKRIDDYQKSNMKLTQTIQYLKCKIFELSHQIQKHKESGKLQRISQKTLKKSYLSEEKAQKNEETPIRYLSQLAPKIKFGHSMKQINIMKISEEEEYLNNQMSIKSWVQFLYVLKEKLNGNNSQQQFINPKLRNQMAKTDQLNSWIDQIQHQINCFTQQNPVNNLVKQHFISQFQVQSENLKILDSFIQFSNNKLSQLSNQVHFNHSVQSEDLQSNQLISEYFNQTLLSVITFCGILMNSQSNKIPDIPIVNYKKKTQDPHKNRYFNMKSDKSKRVNLFINLLQKSQKVFQKFMPEANKMQKCFKMLKLFVTDLNKLLISQ